MFHVFALAYQSTGFLWPTLYFSIVLRAVSVSMYRHASVYTAHCACTAQVRSHLNFLLTDNDPSPPQKSSR